MIRWGIIGTGIHAKNIVSPILGDASLSEFVAVCDIDKDKAQNFAASHGIERVYDSFDKILKDTKLDVLYIATPNSMHAQQTIQAAEAGKHVLCEKPMALNAADCELMIQSCKQNKVKLGVCFQNRYHPAHIEAHRYIQSGEVGEIKTAKAQYARGFPPAMRGGMSKGWRGDPSIAGTGSLVNQAIHCIDLLRYLLESEVVEVRALLDEDPPERPLDQMTYVILRFANGTDGIVVAGGQTPRSDNDATLYGSKAKITCKGTVGMLLQGELKIESDSANIRMDFPTDDPDAMNYVLVREDFSRWIEGNSEPSITGENGMQITRITEAIVKSSREGKAIKIK